MALTKEQINIIRNVESLDELKQKAIDNKIKANDELLLDLYNSYHSESELSDDELDNVTGGCNDDDKTNKEVDKNDSACEHYEYESETTEEIRDAWKKCWFCKYSHQEYVNRPDLQLILVCSYHN